LGGSYYEKKLFGTANAVWEKSVPVRQNGLGIYQNGKIPNPSQAEL
jgi:hypothetical protein